MVEGTYPFELVTPSRLALLGMDDHNIVAYRPRLTAVVGSVLSTLVLCQAMYWARHHSNPFFKFIEPCGHKMYRPGDSWCEELGFTRHEYLFAIKRIGQRMNKDTQADPEAYIWYWTDMSRMTYYRVNWGKVNALYELAYPVNPESGFTKIQKVDLRNAGFPQYENPESGFTYKEQRLTSKINQRSASSGPASPPLPDADADLLSDLLDLGLSRELASKVIRENPRCVVERKIKDSLVALRSGKVSNLQGWAMKVFGGVLYSSVQVAEIVRKRESEEVKEKSRLKPAEQPAEASDTQEEPLPAYTAEDAQAFAWSLKGAAAGIWQARGLDSRIIRAMFREWLQGEEVKKRGSEEGPGSQPSLG